MSWLAQLTNENQRNSVAIVLSRKYLLFIGIWIMIHVIFKLIAFRRMRRVIFYRRLWDSSAPPPRLPTPKLTWDHWIIIHHGWQICGFYFTLFFLCLTLTISPTHELRSQYQCEIQIKNHWEIATASKLCSKSFLVIYFYYKQKRKLAHRCNVILESYFVYMLGARMAALYQISIASVLSLFTFHTRWPAFSHFLKDICDSFPLIVWCWQFFFWQLSEKGRTITQNSGKELEKVFVNSKGPNLHKTSFLLKELKVLVVSPAMAAFSRSAIPSQTSRITVPPISTP